LSLFGFSFFCVMTDFSVRSDSVDVEQIMRQIRARIRDKRGVDYTEDQIRELANAKLERFLDPAGVRSDLLAHFRSGERSPQLYIFEDSTLFDSDKPLVRFIRRLLRPVLKLFFSTNVLTDVLHKQAALNQFLPLYFELLHNLVLETTRSNIELRNLKMRLESVQSRLEFNERRARALEALVQYRPDPQGRENRRESRGESRGESHRQHGSPQRPPQVPVAVAAQGPVMPAAEPGTEPQGGIDPLTGGDSLRTRRRRRRRGRRGQGTMGDPGSGTPAAGPVDHEHEPGEGPEPEDQHDTAGDAGSSREPPGERVSDAAARPSSPEWTTSESGPDSPTAAPAAEMPRTEAATADSSEISTPDRPEPTQPGDRRGSLSEPQ
jgi:hypothetical protein